MRDRRATIHLPLAIETIANLRWTDRYTIHKHTSKKAALKIKDNDKHMSKVQCSQRRCLVHTGDKSRNQYKVN